MTIAITVKVNDGVVLASDSATSLFLGANLYNQYYNADKVFNLKKGHPVGALTWGAGNVGVNSISTLIKDFRKDLSLDSSYTISGVANDLREFLLEAQTEAYGDNTDNLPKMGLRIAGYSKGAELAEEWEFILGEGEKGASEVIVRRSPEQVGLTWSGEPEAIQRLVLGWSPRIALALREMEVPEDQLPQVLEAFLQKTEESIVTPAMPISDAIDLADFVVNLTTQFSRFRPGPQTVGGPTDIAAITRHEGFKWIKRKHYFSQELNPEPDPKNKVE